MINLIKFIRVDDKRLVIIPSKQGVAYHKKEPLVFKAASNSPIVFKEGVEKIGEVEVFAFIATFPNNIIHCEINHNTIENYSSIRIFAGDSFKYFMKIPFNTTAE